MKFSHREFFMIMHAGDIDHRTWNLRMLMYILCKSDNVTINAISLKNVPLLFILNREITRSNAVDSTRDEMPVILL